MPRERQPKPSDLLTARDLVEIYGFQIRTAENIVRRVARAHGGPVQVKDKDGNVLVRRIFVRREWVESSIGQRAS
jgi:hypothetical protein